MARVDSDIINDSEWPIEFDACGSCFVSQSDLKYSQVYAARLRTGVCDADFYEAACT